MITIKRYAMILSIIYTGLYLCEVQGSWTDSPLSSTVRITGRYIESTTVQWANCTDKDVLLAPFYFTKRHFTTTHAKPTDGKSVR